MKSLSRKMRLIGGVLAVALVSLVAGPLMAQGYWPQGGGYAQPQYQQPQYSQPQYSQPQYSQPQYSQPQYSQPQYSQPQTYADQQGYAPQPQLGYAPQGAAMPAMSPDQLEQLVAPIALYPDALVAQILAGATYPAQVAAADQMVHSMGMPDPATMAAAANSQTMWDPSVKALTAYPQVLDMLAGNLQWVTALGNAYYNQPQDVLQTVQVLRMRAEQAGSLVSTPQMQVVQNPGYIALQPVNPDVVYVPTYNPWAVYGAPVQPYPGFSFTGILSTLANAFIGRGGYGGAGFGGGGGPLQFLASFALGAFNRTPFGMIAWGLDWLFNALTFHHSDYYTHSATVRDWGLPHGGPRYLPRAYPAERAGFGGGYNHQAIAVHGGAGFGGERFAGNSARPEGWMRPDSTNRAQQPAFGRNDARPALPQQAFNHAPEQGFRSQPNNGFAPRAVTPQPVRPNAGFNSGSEMYRGQMGGMQSSRPAYPGGGYGGYGNTGRQGGMAYAPTPGFKQNSGGGTHFFGGGHESNGWGGGSYKEPKMQSFKEPKFKEPKMPKMKAPHESHGGGGGHGGGGHHH
jgi:hypothetical protein